MQNSLPIQKHNCAQSRTGLACEEMVIQENTNVVALVDDDESIRSALQSLMKVAGYRTMAFASAGWLRRRAALVAWEGIGNAAIAFLLLWMPQTSQRRQHWLPQRHLRRSTPSWPPPQRRPHTNSTWCRRSNPPRRRQPTIRPAACHPLPPLLAAGSP